MPATLLRYSKKDLSVMVEEHSTHHREQLTSPPAKRPFAPRFSHPSDSNSLTQKVIRQLEHFRMHEEEAKKSVKFDSTIHVILIPCREEYQEAQLTKRLWYSAKEIIKMEKEALVSVSLGHLSEEDDDQGEDNGDVTHLMPW